MIRRVSLSNRAAWLRFFLDAISKDLVIISEASNSIRRRKMIASPITDDGCGFGRIIAVVNRIGFASRATDRPAAGS